MPLDPFAMERWQSTYETEVAYNLSESGIMPVTLASLVDHSWIREVLARQRSATATPAVVRNSGKPSPPSTPTRLPTRSW